MCVSSLFGGKGGDDWAYFMVYKGFFPEIPLIFFSIISSRKINKSNILNGHFVLSECLS